jgi:hypothetical protein
MGITVDGTDIVFDGQVKVVNGFNPDTGVAYLILTPDGGVGTLPFFDDGDPGLPPVFDSITMEEVDPEDDLPTPNPTVTVVSTGGPGIASHYTMKFYVHKGEPGSLGAFQLRDASDVDSGVTLDSTADGYTFVYDSATDLFIPEAQRVGDAYVPSAIASTAFNNTSPRTLATVAIPAQPFPWRPRVFGSTVVTGSSDTRVDLVARLNNASSGDQVGYSKGLAGATPPPNILIPAAPAGSAMPGSYGRVAAGAAATVYLRAEQKAASSNSWSTPADPDTTFWVEISPLL